MRKFIKRTFTNEFADFRNAGIVFKFLEFFPLFVAFFLFEQLCENFVGVWNHGAIFEHTKFPAVFANALLGVEDRIKVARENVGELEEHCDWNEENDTKKSEDDVENSFDACIEHDADKILTPPPCY